MAIKIIHNVEKSIYALLNAPKDVEGGTKVPKTSVKLSEATPEQQKMFKVYHEGYKFLYPVAEKWWKGCVDAFKSQGHNAEEALQLAYGRRPSGAASVPEFVWLIRNFWFACDDLNKTLPLKKRVAPQDFLLQWLVEAGDKKNIELITSMVYWPIGLGDDGEWC
jgi:hypothetical protein